MVTQSLKRFARIGVIRQIAPANLRGFLSPHEQYFAARGFDLGRIGDDLSEDDAEDLARILTRPRAGIPQELVDALYHVDEMATLVGMEALLSEFRSEGYDLPCDPPTPADIAVLAWITDSGLFQHVCARQHNRSTRTFRLYVGRSGTDGARLLDDTGIAAFERDLNDWSGEHMLGRHCTVFPSVTENEHCYIVRRGQPYTRVGRLDGGKSSSLVFRPETFDIVAYDIAMCQLRISAGTSGARDMYRCLAGRHLFGDDDHFIDMPLFSLAPLAREGKDALVCDDVPGLLEVKLRRVQVAKGASQKETVTWTGADVYENPAFIEHCREGMKISRVQLGFKPVGARRSRSCELRSPNIILLPRDEDIVPLGQFLTRRGFILDGRGYIR